MRTKIAAAGLLLASCSLPWQQTRPDETNIAFQFRNNLPIVEARFGNKAGEFILGTAHSQSLLDSSFIKTRHLRRDSRVNVNLGKRRRVAVNAGETDLKRLADGIVGADVWKRDSITIDYHKGLISIAAPKLSRADMTRFRFVGPPALQLNINGATYDAIVDTSIPDTLILPRAIFPANGARRTTVNVTLGGVTFRSLDASVADVGILRIGNRLLAEFLVTIDYQLGEVALWHDPRH